MVQQPVVIQQPVVQQPVGCTSNQYSEGIAAYKATGDFAYLSCFGAQAASIQVLLDRERIVEVTPPPVIETRNVTVGCSPEEYATGVAAYKDTGDITYLKCFGANIQTVKVLLDQERQRIVEIQPTYIGCTEAEYAQQVQTYKVSKKITDLSCFGNSAASIATIIAKENIQVVTVPVQGQAPPPIPADIVSQDYVNAVLKYRETKDASWLAIFGNYAAGMKTTLDSLDLDLTTTVWLDGPTLPPEIMEKKW